MRTMKRKACAASLGLALAAFSVSDVLAQERCKISREVPAGNTTYTQQHVLDVGDVPGHQIRIYELHRIYPADTKPNCEGIKLKESWDRGFSDYVDRNGRTWGYGVVTLENGDRIFEEWDGVSQTIVDPDGAKRSTYTGIRRYTGGTGKYQGVRGLLRDSAAFDPDKKTNQLRSEGEYWFEK